MNDSIKKEENSSFDSVASDSYLEKTENNNDNHESNTTANRISISNDFEQENQESVGRNSDVNVERSKLAIKSLLMALNENLSEEDQEILVSHLFEALKDAKTLVDKIKTARTYWDSNERVTEEISLGRVEETLAVPSTSGTQGQSTSTPSGTKHRERLSSCNSLCKF